MNTTEIFNAIQEQLATLEAEYGKTSKAARGRARSAANNIKKLAAEFKKTSTPAAPPLLTTNFCCGELVPIPTLPSTASPLSPTLVSDV